MGGVLISLSQAVETLGICSVTYFIHRVHKKVSQKCSDYNFKSCKPI